MPARNYIAGMRSDGSLHIIEVTMHSDKGATCAEPSAKARSFPEDSFYASRAAEMGIKYANSPGAMAPIRGQLTASIPERLCILRERLGGIAEIQQTVRFRLFGPDERSLGASGLSQGPKEDPGFEEHVHRQLDDIDELASLLCGQAEELRNRV